MSPYIPYTSAAYIIATDTGSAYQTLKPITLFNGTLDVPHSIDSLSLNPSMPELLEAKVCPLPPLPQSTDRTTTQSPTSAVLMCCGIALARCIWVLIKLLAICGTTKPAPRSNTSKTKQQHRKKRNAGRKRSKKAKQVKWRKAKRRKRIRRRPAPIKSPDDDSLTPDAKLLPQLPAIVALLVVMIIVLAFAYVGITPARMVPDVALDDSVSYAEASVLGPGFTLSTLSPIEPFKNELAVITQDGLMETLWIHAGFEVFVFMSLLCFWQLPAQKHKVSIFSYQQK